jgi:hypothetical protein
MGRTPALALESEKAADIDAAWAAQAIDQLQAAG